jgi:hypothetical protein
VQILEASSKDTESTHIHGIHVPLEEPSTASIADSDADDLKSNPERLWFLPDISIDADGRLKQGDQQRRNPLFGTALLTCYLHKWL